MGISFSLDARRGRAWRVFATSGVIAATGLALSGCAGGVEDDFESGFSVTAAVNEIPTPSTADWSEIWIADLVGMAEAEGVKLTGTPTDWLTGPDGLGPGSRVHLPLPETFFPGRSDAGFETLGWTLTDVERFVSLSAPPTDFTVVAGDFPPLPSSFTTVVDDVVTDIEGEDNAIDFGSVGTVVDAFGRPTRFSQDDNLIAMSSSTDLAVAWEESDKSLGDDPAVRAIAAALDGYGALSAVITPPTTFSGQTILGPGATPDEAKAALEEFDALVPPAPYDLVGIGWAVVDDAPRWIAAYHFTSADGAKDGAQVLRAVWEKGSTITDDRPIADFATVNDVFVKDTTVTIVLTPTEDTSADTLYRLLIQREVLFATR